MRRGTATLAVVTAVSILSAQAARGQAAEVESGIAYVDGGHAEQVLDLHWPAGSPRASLVFVHGGGLKEDGERRTSPRYREVCRPFVAAGIACASAGVPADLVIVPGSHRSSVEDLGEPADPTFAAIRRFIADPRSTDGRR